MLCDVGEVLSVAGYLNLCVLRAAIVRLRTCTSGRGGGLDLADFVPCL